MTYRCRPPTHIGKTRIFRATHFLRHGAVAEINRVTIWREASGKRLKRDGERRFPYRWRNTETCGGASAPQLDAVARHGADATYWAYALRNLPTPQRFKCNRPKKASRFNRKKSLVAQEFLETADIVSRGALREFTIQDRADAALRGHGVHGD
jgi:hypothetical protein